MLDCDREVREMAAIVMHHACVGLVIWSDPSLVGERSSIDEYQPAADRRHNLGVSGKRIAHAHSLACGDRFPGRVTLRTVSEGYENIRT